MRWDTNNDTKKKEHVLEYRAPNKNKNTSNKKGRLRFTGK